MKPYGYVRKDGEGLFIYGEHQFQNAMGAELVPVYLYNTPPQRTWVDLTDEEIEQLEQDTCAMEFPETVRAIEAKLKQKNGYAEEKNT